MHLTRWRRPTILSRPFDAYRRWSVRRGSGRMIRRDGGPYLERHYLLRLGARFTAFLHCFWRDDPDPLHCHPWPWGRIILHGRYREHYHDGTHSDFGPGHVVWRRQALVLHRVELLTDRVWTVFWHWRACRGPKGWGFMHPEGWKPARETGDAELRRMRGFIFPWKAPKAS